MTDTPEIERIRAALAGNVAASGFIGYPEALRIAIAHIDSYASVLASISAELGLPPTIGPAPGALAGLLESVKAQSAEIERLLASLHKIASTVPAFDGSGGVFFVEHHGPDGEYLGCEYVDPMAVIQEIEDIARNAIAT